MKKSKSNMVLSVGSTLTLMWYGNTWTLGVPVIAKIEWFGGYFDEQFLCRLFCQFPFFSWIISEEGWRMHLLKSFNNSKNMCLNNMNRKNEFYRFIINLLKCWYLCRVVISKLKNISIGKWNWEKNLNYDLSCCIHFHTTALTKEMMSSHIFPSSYGLN